MNDIVYRLLKDGVEVNTIVASHAFVDAYANAMGYTYEEVVTEEPAHEPTTEERIAALEENKANQTDVDELNEALALILSGDTGEAAE